MQHHSTTAGTTLQQLMQHIESQAPESMVDADGTLYPFAAGFLRGLVLELMNRVPGAEDYVLSRVLSSGNLP